MSKYYRGDNLPVVADWKGYTIQVGDVITGAILQRQDEQSEYKVLAEEIVVAQETADKIQIEFSREKMKNTDGEVTVEVRLVTKDNVEMTVQKNIELRKDGIR